MTDRYFQNDLPDYGGATVHHSPAQFLATAIDLKDKIVQATWSQRQHKVKDLTLYTGTLGTAFLLLKAYETAGKSEDLALCMDIVETCASAALSMKKYVTFICGRAGIYALGAVAAKHAGDGEKMHVYVNLLRKMVDEREHWNDPHLPYELLYGRVGFLWACLFVNKYIGEETIPLSSMGPFVDTILAAGRYNAKSSSCPLMYEWHGTKYYGAAHGLAGIMHVLMHFPLRDRDAEDVRTTLHYLIAKCFRSGNYPASEGDRDDRLVHWCHGAPGIGLTLCKAVQVFPRDDELKKAAVEAGEVVWRRGLLRRVGLCHGISGNTYVFLALYRVTGDERHLHRGICFSKFLHEHGQDLILSGQMHSGDRPNSLFEGLGGLACLLFDMAEPGNARFPAYEL